MRPARLFMMLMARTVPMSSRSTSKTENGRRSMGSVASVVFTITNCPGSVSAPTSGAEKVSTL